MSDTINLEVVGVETSKGNFQLKGVPVEVWAKFATECAKLTNNEKDGWAEVMRSVIISLLNEEERVLLVTDIPDNYYDAVERECEANSSTFNELIASILNSAESDALRVYTVFETEPEEKSGVFIINGISPISHKKMDIILNQADVSFLEFLQSVERSIRNNKMFISSIKDQDGKNTKDGNTLIFQNVPDATIEYFDKLGAEFSNKYNTVADGENEIDVKAMEMITHLLANASSGQVSSTIGEIGKVE